MNEDYDSKKNVLSRLKNALCEVRLREKGLLPATTPVRKIIEELKREAAESETAEKAIAI